MDYNNLDTLSGKFIAGRLKKFDVYIISVFDDYSEAVSFIKSMLDKWNYRSGIPIVFQRHKRDLSEQELGWLKPYRDDILFHHIDVDKYEKDLKKIRNRKKNQRRKNKLKKVNRKNENRDI